MKHVVIGVSALTALMASSAVFSETATLRTSGELVIPSVSVGGTAFAVSLQILDGVSPFTFALTDVYGELASEQPSAAYQDPLVTFNSVAFRNDLYTATMELIPGSNPLTFKVTGVELVCQGCAEEALPDDGMALRSSAFAPGAPIPAIHSCDGPDTSLPLTWTAGPSGTASYAVIMDDPDAQAVAGFTWVHWNLYDIPAPISTLPADASFQGLPAGAVEGLNDFGASQYGGPCPPMGGGTHTYRIQVFAMDQGFAAFPMTPMTLEELATNHADHILGRSNVLTGTYSH